MIPAAVEQREARPPIQGGDDGASPIPRLHRNEWRVWRADHIDAAYLIRLFHYTKSSSNTGRAFVLVRLADWVRFGASLWIPPTKSAAQSIAGDDAEWTQVLACSRLVCTPDAPKNAASFLLAHSRRQIDRTRWPILVAYADTAHGHTGAIYLADGWICDGPVAAGDVWVNERGEQRGRKRGGKTLTVSEMRAAGFTKSPVAPKIRFRHVLDEDGPRG